MMHIVLSVSAESDLREILSFYKAPSPLADAFSYTFESGIAHLERWPYTGHRRRDLTKADLCFWFEDPYFFVFQIKNDVMSVIAILHSSRNLPPILRKRLKGSR